MKTNEKDTIYFPRNVESDYQIIVGISWKEIKTYILPAMFIITIIALSPPYSIMFWIIKFILFFLIAIILVVLIFCRPIPTRKNIRTVDWLRMHKNFKNRQKIFYMNKKDRTIDGK